MYHFIIASESKSSLLKSLSSESKKLELTSKINCLDLAFQKIQENLKTLAEEISKILIFK